MEQNVPSEQILEFVQLLPLELKIVPLEQIVLLEQNVAARSEKTHDVITLRFIIGFITT